MITKNKPKLKVALLQTYTQETATDYDIRIEEVNGSTFWVLPVVMMVEGVHQGSRGPILYTTGELSATVNAWNGMPVTIGHPQDEDERYISANLPGVFEEIVGRIYNPRMVGNKLMAEAWVDSGLLALRSTDAVEYIKERKALDVSVGVFSKETKDGGEWNDETYRSEAFDIVPDHLALLPGEDGACSWNDGCGIRNNSKDKKMKVNKKVTAKDDYKPIVTNHLTTNEASFNEIQTSIYTQLNGLDSEDYYYYLEEVYDTHFIYCRVNRKTSDRKMYKQDYSVTNNIAEVSGDPTQVRKEVAYVNVNKQESTKQPKRTNFNTKSKSEMKTNGKCTCTVDSLIDNKATNFTEEDREWLSELPQEQLNKLAPKDEVKAPVANKKATESTEDEPSLVKVNKEGEVTISGKSIGDYVKEALSKETDPMKFIDNSFPDGMKDQMKSGYTMYQNRRTSLIKEIAANSKFKEDQLKGWSDADLTALHESLVDNEETVGNYALQSSGAPEGGEGAEDASDEISAMMSFNTPVKVEEKKK